MRLWIRIALLSQWSGDQGFCTIASKYRKQTLECFTDIVLGILAVTLYKCQLEKMLCYFFFFSTKVLQHFELLLSPQVKFHVSNGCKVINLCDSAFKSPLFRGIRRSGTLCFSKYYTSAECFIDKVFGNFLAVTLYKCQLEEKKLCKYFLFCFSIKVAQHFEWLLSRQLNFA